jgi:hypothetical protein
LLCFVVGVVRNKCLAVFFLGDSGKTSLADGRAWGEMFKLPAAQPMTKKYL